MPFRNFFRTRRFGKLERDSQLDYRIGRIGIDRSKLELRKRAMTRLNAEFAGESHPVLLKCLADKHAGPLAASLLADAGPGPLEAIIGLTAASSNLVLHANAIEFAAADSVRNLDFLEAELLWGLEVGESEYWGKVVDKLVENDSIDRVAVLLGDAIVNDAHQESTQLEAVNTLRELGTCSAVEALAAAAGDGSEDNHVRRHLLRSIEELKVPENPADIEALTGFLKIRYLNSRSTPEQNAFAIALRRLGYEPPPDQSEAFERALEVFDGGVLLEAAECGDSELVRYQLNRSGADPEFRSTGEITPLMLATHFGHAEVVRLLLEAGASVNSRNSEGWTPVMAGAQQGAIEIVRLLTDAGANLDTTNREGCNALAYAKNKLHRDVANYLESRGAKLPRGARFCETCGEGWTSLSGSLSDTLGDRVTKLEANYSANSLRGGTCVECHLSFCRSHLGPGLLEDPCPSCGGKMDVA